MVPLKKEQKNNLNLIKKDFEEGSEEELNYYYKLIDNVKFVRDVIKGLRPETLVVEMCDDRYERWLAEPMDHPNYENTI